ncbi:MAG: hypothetical protein Q6L19_03970, partial [Gloeomargarita sp. GMQP_bins_69]
RRSALLARVQVGDLALSVAVAHLSLAVLDNVPQERWVLDALAERPGPHLLLGDLNRRTAWVRGPAAARGLHLRPRVLPCHACPSCLLEGRQLLHNLISFSLEGLNFGFNIRLGLFRSLCRFGLELIKLSAQFLQLGFHLPLISQSIRHVFTLLA